MNNNQMINMLTVVLTVMIGILFILCLIFVVLKIKSNKPKRDKKKEEMARQSVGKNSVAPQNYSKQSIFKFMEFDKIDDSMIVQKNGKRFLMILECQGVNYDLMSGLEKNSVEQGFLQFLNTLRYPIQIYVQTRTVNLTSSIDRYKEKIDEISKEYAAKQAEYNQKARSGRYTPQELEKEKYEIARQRNLYEYAIDIINNTQRMSLNKNILSKNYYIIIPYYSEEAANTNYDKTEIQNLAFSELYTKAQSIVNSLAVSGIKSKVLDSTEIAELLYVAYNRDESEIFNLRRALNAGYEDLYSTAPDVLDKRMKELDIKVEEEAIKKANDIIFGIVEESQKQKEIRQKEKELDELIDQMAEILIEENRENIGEEVADQAINILKNENSTKEEEGGEVNEQKTKTRRTRRIRKTI